MKLNNKKIIIISASVILVFLVITIGISYFTNFQDPISNSFKEMYPAAFIGSKNVTIANADKFILLVNKSDPSIGSIKAYENFLMRTKSEVLLDKLGLDLKSDELSDEYNFYTKGNDSVFGEFINEFFDNDVELFKDYIVKYAVVESKLRTYYNSKIDLNKDKYAKANMILDELSKGTKFEDLAKLHSDDKETGQLGGDLGFYEHGQILPELEKEIAILKFGEVSKKIVITRNGYHIVYPIEVATKNGQKSWHAKYILIETNGFDEWLKEQLKTINVRQLKKY
jgi:hypothetical protein